MAISTVRRKRQVTLPREAEDIGLVEGAPLSFKVDHERGILTVSALNLTDVAPFPEYTDEDIAAIYGALEDIAEVSDDGLGTLYETEDDAHAGVNGTTVKLKAT